MGSGGQTGREAFLGTTVKGQFVLAPKELRAVIFQFWPADQLDNAAAISRWESGWNAFAVRDTTDSDHPCGAELAPVDGVGVTAELSVGYFQINTCEFPEAEWQRFYNAELNAQTAYNLWTLRGWEPWYFTASKLGLL